MSTVAVAYSHFPEAESNERTQDIVFGKTRAMSELRRQIASTRDTDLPVLISGESGTGKEVIARLLHAHSQRNTEPFVKVTCPAIPGQLFESELFGYEKGAFTGAFSRKVGRVEVADKGSLFLDEIGELELGLQAKLLQVLQEGRFSPLGSQEEKKVQVRWICATNRNLEEEIEAGKFRCDLFYRINVINLRVIPLRERTEDIPDLTEYFLNRYNEQFSKRAPMPCLAVIEHLKRYPWPGNIRQLENVIKRYVVLGTIDIPSHSEKEFKRNSFVQGMDIDLLLIQGGDISLKRITKEAALAVEKEVIMKSLQRHNWNRRQTAQTLKISYRALIYKMKDAGLGGETTRIGSCDSVMKDQPAM